MITICCLLIFWGRVRYSKCKIKIFSIGVFILQRYSLHYIFIINIAIGIFAIILRYFVFPKKSHKTEPLNIDYTEFILFIITIISFIYVENKINSPLIDMSIFNSNAFSLGLIEPLNIDYTEFILFIITIISFIYVENKINSPLIDMSIFNSNAFSLGLICALLIFSSNLFLNTLIPFYLQNTLKISPLLSWFLLMTVPISMVIVAPISGTLSDKIGSEDLTLVSLLFQILLLLLLYIIVLVSLLLVTFLLVEIFLQVEILFPV